MEPIIRQSFDRLKELGKEMPQRKTLLTQWVSPAFTSLLFCAFFWISCTSPSSNGEHSHLDGGHVEGHPEEAFKPFPRHKPWNMAHRGGKHLYPQSTMIAFKSAIKDHNIDVIELDVVATKDGIVVVQHDQEMHKTTDCKKDAKDMLFKDHQKCNAAIKFKPLGGGKSPYEGQFHPHPSLEEVFKAFPNMFINIEIKQYEPSIAKTVVSLIEKYKRVDKVIVVAFAQGTVDEMKKANPKLKTGYGLEEMGDFLNALKDKEAFKEYKATGYAIQPPFAQVTKDFVDSAHSKGLEVHPWTVNDKAIMKKLLNLGVDGIITDRPDLMKEALKEFGK